VSDKRSYSRYALWFPVTVDAASQQMWAVCKDVSAGGILISGSAKLAIGDVVTVSFRVSADAEERRVAGRIVRVEDPDPDPRAVWSHRMAIEFLEPDATLQATFARASSRPPVAP
jgi:PilZ domain